MLAADFSHGVAKFPIVALEGASGIGKSTMLHMISEELGRANVSFDLCSNNDSGRWSAVIRDLAGTSDRPLTLALATAAARAELRESAQRPQLCDRFVVSTLVYQRFAGVPVKYLYEVNRPVLAESVTFVLRLEAEALEARRRSRPAKSDWFKDRLKPREEIEFYDEAATLLKEQGHDVRVVDASPDQTTLARALAAEIADMWQRTGS
ncbi:AAA family ATPase [Bradyrhizobium sp. 83002]|uniref:dTMP kinase n=1 Tax=Bradyrhizobium aeschynomenes TaxID=2734909 RepID=UPI001555A164|nr:AAA family ATPase [Bradyrhizobium aeschynomenes]NPU15164.1 AAA family ATPase [Bradyrhizobium aeschynomenes]